MLYDVTYRPEKSTELFDSADVNGLMLMDEMARVISEYSKVSQEVESVEQDIKIEVDQEPTETKVITGKLLHTVACNKVVGPNKGITKFRKIGRNKGKIPLFGRFPFFRLK